MKKSYTIPCSSHFRDAVTTLAESRGVNVGDLARSILLALPTDILDTASDPGEPGAEDRETVILKSGPSKGRPWRRKPRLQVRMAEGSNPEQIRKALGVALALADGELDLHLHDPNAAPEPVAPETVPEPPAPEPPPMPEITPQLLEAEAEIRELQEEVDRLRAVISVLAFDPLHHGIQSREDAYHVLGFPPGSRPSRDTVRARFRMLATIHHPDSPYGSHERMSQLNSAVAVLRDIA